MQADSEGKGSPKINIVQQPLIGAMWCAAWLFTIGFLHLNFWRGVLAVIVWPYYLGTHFSSLMR
jgi:hypothetical protein